jgi:hypothetical protein
MRYKKGDSCQPKKPANILDYKAAAQKRRLAASKEQSV